MIHTYYKYNIYVLLIKEDIMFKKHKLDNFQYALIIIFLLATLLIPILYVANVSSYLTSKFAWFYVIFALLIIGFFAFILIFNLIKFRHAINRSEERRVGKECR